MCAYAFFSAFVVIRLSYVFLKFPRFDWIPLLPPAGEYFFHLFFDLENCQAAPTAELMWVVTDPSKVYLEVSCWAGYMCQFVDFKVPSTGFVSIAILVWSTLHPRGVYLSRLIRPI